LLQLVSATSNAICTHSGEARSNIQHIFAAAMSNWTSLLLCCTYWATDSL